MERQVWIIAGVLTGLLLVGLVGLSSCRKQQQLAQSKVELADAKAALARAMSEAGALKEKVAADQAEIERLKQEKESANQKQKTLEDEMRSALESRDVTISQLQGKLTVNILDRILFDSGEAVLKPGGAAVLDKVAAVLAQHPTLKIHVIGHTDNVPIRSSARSRFASNWELSTARATAAVRYLTESAGVAPGRLGVVGYGEFRPIADNATPEGRARNRRIAITILSDEVAGADTAQPLQPSPAGDDKPAAADASGGVPPVPNLSPPGTNSAEGAVPPQGTSE